MTLRNHRRRAPSPPILMDELIVEILSWLPVRSLLRFRCVCKSWKSLISDPQFVKLHFRRSSTKADFTYFRLILLANVNDRIRRRFVCYSVNSLLQNPSSTIAEDLCYPMEKDYSHHYWVVGSCNGLLCLVHLFTDEVFDKYRIHIWNPATGVGLQKSVGFLPWIDINCLSDQDRSPNFGFGYDHLSDTYKVVIILFNTRAEEDLQKTIVKVHSMGEEGYCWRKIHSFPAAPVRWKSYGEYLGGTLNWVAVRNIGANYEWDTVTIDQLVIVSLDLGEETCRQLLLPLGLDEVPHVEPELGVLRDCLCVSHDYRRTHFVVWQMKEFGVERSWTQLLNVTYLDLQTRSLDNCFRLLPICMSKAGDVLLLSWSWFAEARVILHNSRDDRIELSEILNHMQLVYPQVHVESLGVPC